MQSYYEPQDLGKFEEIGEEAPGLAQKFFDYYGSVFAEGELTEREISHSPCGGTCRSMSLLHRRLHTGLFGKRL